MRLGKKIIKISSIILIIIFVSGFDLFFFPRKDLFEGIHFSKAVYGDKHQLLRMSLSSDETFRLYTPLSHISKELIEASLLQEDRYFRNHFGVNPVSLVKAFWQTYVRHYRRVGASTITMQLARIRYGIHSKTLWGKVVQIVRAIQLEMHYSKDEILEAYLNLAPYGANIEGVGAASLIYFNKSVSNLSLPQALTLSIIPQNPSKRGAHNRALKTMRDKLFARWLIEHPNDKSKQNLFSLPLVTQDRRAMPFIVPHVVNQVLKESSLHEETIETSLDLYAQTIIERISRHYIARKKIFAVTNAAVLLVDTRDMQVKASLGSIDFFNKAISGQINGVEIKRSPGSTLKPFIYGLALDQGLIHPNTVLKDVPQSFHGFNPENFDYDFMGPIKAKDALVLSRNVPAIGLANQLHPSLYRLLEKAQVSHLKAESYYGLSLNLGGVELTLRELVALYAMLVNDGVFYPVQYLKQNTKSNGHRLLSPEASFLVLDMLQNQAHSIQRDLPIAFKTGTSSAYRDAWTLGAFGPYVLGVWIGNFDNKGNPAFVGKDIASPLFFELVDALRQEWKWIPPVVKDMSHMNLKKIRVCKASGLLPNRYCPDTEWTWFIPLKSPIKRDTVHREVAVNNLTGLRTCHIDNNTRFEIFEFWPSDVLGIFKKAGIQRQTPPFFEKDCALSQGFGSPPQITSPQKGIHYIVRVNACNNNKIPLTAVTDAGIEYIYWFINGSFIAKTKANEPYLWQAKPGHFILRVVDSHGLTDVRDIDVEMEA